MTDTMRLAIVSGHAHTPLTPRGERTRALAGSFGPETEVDVFGPPRRHTAAPTSLPAASARRARTVARHAVEMSLLDKWEPWSARHLGRRWDPRADAALLIAYPFSPAVYAARRLERLGVPYVVDAGDPWRLTASDSSERHLGAVRSRRAERRLWAGAAGAVLTTDQQAATLGRLFPGLPILVRPNGFWVEEDPPPGQSPGPDPGRLDIAHFGMLSSARLDVVPLLQTLRDSGLWERITFSQYGDDFTGMLARVPAGVVVERHHPRPWPEVVALSGRHDVALVVGNRDPRVMASKAVQYLTLPIPRMALTIATADDALAAYARRTPGWLVLAPDDPRAPELVARHVGRSWSAEELRPPTSEAWPVVAETVADFVAHCTGLDRRRQPVPLAGRGSG